jgi:hypothetical protein
MSAVETLVSSTHAITESCSLPCPPRTKCGSRPAPMATHPLVARSVYLRLAGLGLAPANAGPDNRAPESAKRRPKAR